MYHHSSISPMWFYPFAPKQLACAWQLQNWFILTIQAFLRAFVDALSTSMLASFVANICMPHQEESWSYASPSCLFQWWRKHSGRYASPPCLFQFSRATERLRKVRVPTMLVSIFKGDWNTLEGTRPHHACFNFQGRLKHSGRYASSSYSFCSSRAFLIQSKSKV